MENFPLVSVTVITYCSASTVISTLESIKHQTYPNIELIISDDCSRDSTVTLCQEWISANRDRFVRVKLITSEINTGTSANINRAIKECTGIFRKSIAGDDLLEPNCILSNVEYIGDADACYSDLIFFDEAGLIEYHSDVPILMALATLPTRKRLKLYCQTMVFCNVPTWFVRMNIYEKIGLYDESSTILEDVPFLVKFFSSDLKVKYLQNVTVRYRSGGVSHDPKKRTKMQHLLSDAYIKYCKPNIIVENFSDVLLLVDRKFWTLIAKHEYDFLLRLYLSKYNFVTSLISNLLRKRYIGYINN